MASSTALAHTLTDEQLGDLLELMADADSVELKLTVPESDHYSVAATLGMDPLDAQIRQIYFFDTPDLRLNQHGVVLRARRVQGKSGDCVAKLRPLTPRTLSKSERRSSGFTVELDAMPEGYVCSGTMKRSVANADVRQVVAGARPLSALFSTKQRAFLYEHAPDGLVLDELSLLGPILVLKLKFDPEGYQRRLVAELWMYPDNSRVLELSTKCDPGEAFQVAAETRAFLSRRGVDLSGKQETKTLRALEFFAARLADSTARSDAPAIPGR
jgi:hypothetical protein